MRVITISRSAVLVALLATAATSAEAIDCQEFFAGGQPPQVRRLSSGVLEMCFEGFATSNYGAGGRVSALWSAERLTAAEIAAAKRLERPKGQLFHEESRLPDDYQAKLTEFSHSGYDRGHLSPSGDGATSERQIETFSLANMVPQAPALNRGAWARMESSVRDYAQTAGTAYVVTGPAMIGSTIDALKGRLLVPTHVWKAIYDPVKQRGVVFWAANQDQATIETITPAELERRTGIRVFPAIPVLASNEMLSVPLHESGGYRPAGHGAEHALWRGVLRLIR